MNITHLEYFLEVVRQGSFSKAAAALHVTQPSISKMIQSLEDELGATLIIRNAKQIELTDAGKVILAQAQQIVERFQNLTAELDDIVHLKKGKIRIGLPHITGSTVLPRMLGEFNQRFPNIQIQLFEFGSKKIQSGVQEGSLDIGIVCTLPAKTDIFAVVPLLKDPLRVIVHPGHPLAQKQTIRFTELANESFVMYSEDFSLFDCILDRCRAAGFEPKIICQTAQREFMTQMVAAKLGIALLPSAICDGLDPREIVPIAIEDPQIYLELAMIWRKDRYISFAARSWLDFTASRLTPAAIVPNVS
ncbi:MAG: LysR family transcriptional regulator [Negativicutes bacterium]|nr:LysR family transcriptional regulator [Negativicutes bacterium]